MTLLGPTAIAHSDIADGFSSSVTSQVAGPSGSISHTAVAVDPVYGSQFTGLTSIDNTQADWQNTTPWATPPYRQDPAALESVGGMP